MKHLAAQFIPMLNSQAAKFDPGCKLHHLKSSDEHMATYDELERRLSVDT